MAQIDWAFIGTLEGEAITRGYVPSDKSGVTIATGVDLGQKAMPELLALGLGAALTDKLKPYLGLKGDGARGKLNSAPLTLSAAEVAQLDQAMRARFVAALVAAFNFASQTGFDALKPAQQTVIASVAYQYGTGLDQRTPNFWRQVTTGDWPGAIANLRNFGDDYSTRRNKEANYLAAA
jgi:GH24 family phage-related lysozyme (muramidase)